MDQLTKNNTPVSPGKSYMETVEKVGAMLQDGFPDVVSYGDGSFTLTGGSASVMVVVRPFSEEKCYVEILSNVVSGATVTDKLMSFLLRKNAELHFGGFGVLFDGTVVFSHTVPASNLTEEVLTMAVSAVAVVSDHYDDEIVAMAGGKRAADVETEQEQSV